MAEMILPGTYIEERAEGLISAGRVATGIVGIVGTAAAGPVDSPAALSGYADALEKFGAPDDFNQPRDGTPLTLVRALKYLYGNGATSVIAVRAAKGGNDVNELDKMKAKYLVRDDAGNEVVKLAALTPGTWANDMQIKVEEAKSNAQIVREQHKDPLNQLNYGHIAPLDKNQIRVYNGITKQWVSPRVKYEQTNAVTPGAGEVVIVAATGALKFPASEAPNVANGDMLEAFYEVDRNHCVQISLTFGAKSEVYTVPDGRWLAELISNKKQPSKLVTATVDVARGTQKPKRLDKPEFFGAGSNTGNNGADAGAEDYARGLNALANKLVNIVVLAGQDVDKRGTELLDHLKSTEETDHERIGVIGAKPDDFLTLNKSDGRLIVVAPGLIEKDKNETITELPTGYTAAAVAGLISSLPVQASLTNKPINLPGLRSADEFNRGEQIELLKGNLLTIINKEKSLRVLRGITTAGEGTPFALITTRRIVDYAKYGVRSAANPYLGRLNNARVRAALKATIDGFLTRMVNDEALTSYMLDVAATRSQEIAGEVSVIMTLQPTFSIEFIRVVMNLQ